MEKFLTAAADAANKVTETLNLCAALGIKTIFTWKEDKKQRQPE